PGPRAGLFAVAAVFAAGACAPLRDGAQVRDPFVFLRVDGVVDGLPPGPHDESLRVGVLWLGADDARYVGVSTPAVVENGGYAFHLEIHRTGAAPEQIAYRYGWWVGYLVFFADTDGDGTAKLIGNAFVNDQLLGVAPLHVVYESQGAALPPFVDGGGAPAPSGFLVDDGAARVGYHLAEAI